MVDIKELKNAASSFSLLYVEDDKEIAQSFIAYLSKFFKEVVYAENGEEGLDLYNQGDYELVLTDINMPKMNGLEMATKMKEINQNQNIVIVSAYSDIDKFITSIKLGIDGYIIKPINYTDMNNLLFKLVTKIKKFRENDINTEQQKVLLGQISRNNNELRQYTDVLNQVAIVSKMDNAGNITFVNDFFCELTGYTSDELVGQNHHILRHKDMSKNILNELWDTVTKGQVWKGTIKNKTKTDEPYFVLTTIIPLYEVGQEKIKEYISVSFLTTKEETERREFKKKVMTTYQEFRKHSFDANKRIETLEKEKKNLVEEELYQKELLQDLKNKHKKALSQIKFYEDEIEKKDLHYKKVLANSSNNSKSITTAYKKAIVQIDTQKEEMVYLRKDNKLRTEEVHDLLTKLNDQSIIIRDLRDTIKNINDRESGKEVASHKVDEETKKKNFFGI